MSSLDILNATWHILTGDAEILSHLNLTSQSTVEQKAGKVQKEREPEGLAKNNVPMICMYPENGLPSQSNSMIYDSEVQIDIYAVSLFKCMTIGKRIQKLLNGTLPQVADGQSFEFQFMGEFAGESKISGVKKYSQRWILGDAVWR